MSNYKKDINKLCEFNEVYPIPEITFDPYREEKVEFANEAPSTVSLKKYQEFDLYMNFNNFISLYPCFSDFIVYVINNLEFTDCNGWFATVHIPNVLKKEYLTKLNNIVAGTKNSNEKIKRKLDLNWKEIANKEINIGNSTSKKETKQLAIIFEEKKDADILILNPNLFSHLIFSQINRNSKKIKTPKHLYHLALKYQQKIKNISPEFIYKTTIFCLLNNPNKLQFIEITTNNFLFNMVFNELVRKDKKILSNSLEKMKQLGGVRKEEVYLQTHKSKKIICDSFYNFINTYMKPYYNEILPIKMIFQPKSKIVKIEFINYIK